MSITFPTVAREVVEDVDWSVPQPHLTQRSTRVNSGYRRQGADCARGAARRGDAKSMASVPMPWHDRGPTRMGSRCPGEMVDEGWGRAADFAAMTEPADAPGQRCPPTTSSTTCSTNSGPSARRRHRTTDSTRRDQAAGRRPMSILSGLGSGRQRQGGFDTPHNACRS